MPLAAGAELDGYEILGLLGVGGMGEVYRARDRVLKRDVAIKVLPSFVSQDPDRLRRFEQEAQAAAALNHPNILGIHRFGTFEGTSYLVSELLVGDTLRQQMERGPLPVRKAIDYSVQVAHGLAAAHDKGIVHRDLKPENLFVTKDGRIKILDFGLAKLIPSQPEPDGSAPTQAHATDPGLIMGTVGYMSPEQVRGLSVDHRADIFAFGAILYELLAGKRAFQRATSADTMSAILHEDPPSISQIVQTTPPGLQRVVQRCLEKNPEQRFQSASDLAFALEALSESSISAAAVPNPTSSQRSVRKPILWATYAGALLVILIGAYLVLSRQNKDAPLRISEYKQLTHSGQAGIVIGTDGSRIYLQRGVGQPIGQVAVAGGEIEPVAVPLPNPLLQSLSPDGSAFLVESWGKGLSPLQPLYSVQIIGGAHRYLAESQGANWTPDGKSVVYFTPDGDSHIMRSDGSDAHKLASLGGIPDSFTWSPDGKTIRFATKGKLWEMSASGSDIHALLPGWRPAETQCCGAWSADGTFFFTSEPGRQIWALHEERNLFRKTPEQPEQLTSGPIRWGPPVPSKDGKVIFADGYTRRGELVRFDPQSKTLQPFLGGISAEFVSFSNDGQSIAYVSYPDGILWKAKPDGSERVQLSAPPIAPRLLSWSPDSSQILFVDSPAQGSAETYVVSSQGGGARRLLPGDSAPETDPNWSPDGRKIAFGSSPEAGKDQTSDIRILDIDSHQVTVLPGSVGMFSPHWSPDGKSIAAESTDSSTLRIFNLKTRQWSDLYKGELAFPTWSRDSRSIFFLTYRSDPGVFRIHIGGGEPERLVDLKDVQTTGFYGLWLGLDSTDAPLLLRDVGTDDIYALTLEKK